MTTRARLAAIPEHANRGNRGAGLGDSGPTAPMAPPRADQTRRIQGQAPIMVVAVGRAMPARTKPPREIPRRGYTTTKSQSRRYRTGIALVTPDEEDT